jgi:peptidoglycan hydrolase-like protein with peptidoglycan-binding domain
VHKVNHLEAKALVDALHPGASGAESLYLRLVAWHETSYGMGWKTGEGAGSNNMGAIIALHPDALSFKHVDSKFDPKVGHVVEYVTWFAGWATPALGFAGLRDILLKDNVRAALAKSDLRGAVSSQYANGYFMGLHTHVTAEGNDANVQDYLTALLKALDTICTITKEPRLFDAPPIIPMPPGLALARGDVTPDGDLRLRILRQGMVGPLVRVWQTLLRDEYPEEEGLPITGRFDAETVLGTKEWQAKQGLPADGVVGLLSWSRMLT